MGPIALVCAMPMELRPLTRRLHLRSDRDAGHRHRVGMLDDRRVVGIVTGMGTALAHDGVSELLTTERPAIVAIVGIAGAVDDTTPIGTVIAPARVIDGATGRTHAHAPITPHAPQGALWTTDRLTTSPELPALREQGVIALDMETAAIAAVCELAGVHWTVVRAISDRATDGSVDEEVFGMSNQDGSASPAAVVRYLARHPTSVPKLARMGRDARTATERAASAAIDALRGWIAISPR